MTTQTVKKMTLQELTIPPDFSVSERDVPQIGDVKAGQRMRMVLSYTVIEKTRSFTILRITGIYPFPSKRKI